MNPTFSTKKTDRKISLRILDKMVFIDLGKKIYQYERQD
jgi:hypothetical protein